FSSAATGRSRPLLGSLIGLNPEPRQRLLAQLELLDLPRSGRQWKLADEHDVPRHLESGELGAQKRQDFFLARRDAVLRDDEGDANRTLIAVGQTDYSSRFHGRMLKQDVFDLRRRHVEAACLVAVAEAPLECEASVGT